ncbi:PREDICTED: uncharacterized protein LOC104608279 isoform X3 [Nelumbo nucifera]|uniref:Pentatricopeptide repeat-containing protein n=2 Tax=Nelumbo nucifera TaxID=4432 RepID=A0A822XRW5_NELNU|nr:PREDICTED: uncharacterized protein LOC104608279 isoform X3 [Nelumbo nucifera]DAD24344.1 TPA_asm: hypothetical protein HUJ06_025808 [Nelumbo nucifera]
MALNLLSPWHPRFSHPSSPLSKIYAVSPNGKSALLLLLLSRCNYEISAFRHLCCSISSSSSRTKNCRTRASLSERENMEAENSVSGLLDDELLSLVSSAKDANEALEMIAEKSQKNGGVVGTSDCYMIITAAFGRNNADLALSVFSAMRSSFDEGISEQDTVERWKWSRPNVQICASMVQGLAASLRVTDAIRTIGDACRVGVSAGEEVTFGKIVRCPTCMIAIAVAQPQNGIQIATCSKCRYKYELVSGDVVSIESEEISMDIPAWERWLRFLQVMKQSIPAAVHSIVVQTPSRNARTYRFATKTVELPAQEGERITISLAAPPNIYRDVGPLRLNPKVPGFNPGEPICLTNHTNGQESQLLRAPIKNGSLSLLSPSVLFPALVVLATGDAASGIINPSLPQFIFATAVASLAIGTTVNGLVLPQLSRVWMLARMCQLENKILAVGEPSYRARRSRVQRVRQSLETSIMGRIELIDSYARISSMIEIEVEMDSDVLAAEAVSNAESIAEQIQQIMELENLEERWRMQAEANDEVERLLSSQPVPTE